MKSLSSLGIGLSFVFGCLFLALVAELYYLLWWKKRIINREIEDDYSSSSRELFYLLCWKKPTSLSSRALHPHSNMRTSEIRGRESEDHLHLHSCSGMDYCFKPFGEETIESELMRLHNLPGPPRFLFTIKEETKEDLESDDAKSRGDTKSRRGSRSRSLTELFSAETPYLTPLSSPSFLTPPLTPNNRYSHHGFNPLFESSTEAVVNKALSSPPPKFKFLQDAEEKLQRKLLLESAAVSHPSHGPPVITSSSLASDGDGSFITIIIGKNKELKDHHHSTSSQCIFLLSDSGEVILEKQLTTHHVDRSICMWFWEQVITRGDPSQLLPVIASPTHYIFQIVQDGITFLACTQAEMPPLMGIEFLCRVADVLSDYFGGLNEDIIKDNFVIVYELLDEMIDNGFPLTTEPNVLRQMIAPPNIVSKVLSVVTGNSSSMSSTLPGATASNIPWRTTDLKHANNEVYVDLHEEMDATVSRDGILTKCEIFGEVQVNSHLSGLPELTLSFANSSILNDVRFHPCVRFRPWESHQILSFVPPDGHFKLMSYRVKKLKNTPIYVKPQITSDSGTCRINVLVGIRNDPGKAIDGISIKFQLPSCVAFADLTSNHGTVTVLANKECSWSIGRIPKDKTPSLTGTLSLDTGLDRLYVLPTFQVSFRIMGVALSGLQIDKLDVLNAPSRLYKGFRALTEAGEYFVRS